MTTSISNRRVTFLRFYCAAGRGVIGGPNIKGSVEISMRLHTVLSHPSSLAFASVRLAVSSSENRAKGVGTIRKGTVGMCNIVSMNNAYYPE